VRHRLAEQLLPAKLNADALLELAKTLELGLAERGEGFLGDGGGRRRGVRCG
jgi:hypothetical protein